MLQPPPPPHQSIILLVAALQPPSIRSAVAILSRAKRMPRQLLLMLTVHVVKLALNNMSSFLWGVIDGVVKKARYCCNGAVLSSQFTKQLILMQLFWCDSAVFCILMFVLVLSLVCLCAKCISSFVWLSLSKRCCSLLQFWLQMNPWRVWCYCLLSRRMRCSSLSLLYISRWTNAALLIDWCVYNMIHLFLPK